MRAGRLNGYRAVVAQELVDSESVDHTKKAQVLCMHGHVEFYPTTRVCLGIGAGEEEEMGGGGGS